MRENADSRDWVEVVKEQVSKTAFGEVQIVIHDSQVLRIERTEKLLLAQSKEPTRRLEVKKTSGVELT